MTPHLYDRLTGPEKAALTRQWQSFSRAAEATVVPEDTIITDIFTGRKRPLVEGQERGVAALRARAALLATLAARRDAYLFAIETTWFRLLWDVDRSLIKAASLPADYFRQGQSLDDILWEEHPVNLFQSLEEEAGL